MDRIQIALYGIKIVGLTLLLAAIFLLTVSQKTRKRGEVLMYGIGTIILIGLIGLEIFDPAEYEIFTSLIIFVSGLIVFLLTYYKGRY